MKYSNIIEDMTWSYSRITCFEDCKYKFFLKYILEKDSCNLFFSDYGSFMHNCIEKYFKKELSVDELPSYYLQRFFENVKTKPPSYSVFKNYFHQGLEYLKNIENVFGEIIGVEERIEFNIDDLDMVGIIDLVYRNGDKISICDNKSRTLKPRSKRKKPTKTDKELDDYLRQLYLYSIPLSKIFSSQPERLVFNCFRNPNVIEEKYDERKTEDIKVWIKEKVNEIINEEKWEPNIDFFKCRYLCDVKNHCEYYELNNK